MDYDDACEYTPTRSEIEREIKAHGSDPRDFFDDTGNKTEYTGQDVLNWLGY